MMEKQGVTRNDLEAEDRPIDVKVAGEHFQALFGSFGSLPSGDDPFSHMSDAVKEAVLRNGGDDSNALSK